MINAHTALPYHAYLVVDDAAVSLEDRRVRLDHLDVGFSGLLQLLVLLSDARVVRISGSVVETADVHQEQACAQGNH